MQWEPWMDFLDPLEVAEESLSETLYLPPLPCMKSDIVYRKQPRDYVGEKEIIGGG